MIAFFFFSFTYIYIFSSALHNIVKLNRQLDTELATVFNAGTMYDLWRHFRIEVFGKPARLNTSIKVEVLDLLAV